MDEMVSRSSSSSPFSPLNCESWKHHRREERTKKSTSRFNQKNHSYTNACVWHFVTDGEFRLILFFCFSSALPFSHLFLLPPLSPHPPCKEKKNKIPTLYIPRAEMRKRQKACNARQFREFKFTEFKCKIQKKAHLGTVWEMVNLLEIFPGRLCACGGGK